MVMPLARAVDLAVRGEFPPDSVQVGEHTFFIRALSNKNLLQGDETCYFRHQHVGDDDRVFFSVKVKGKDSYEAKITRIQFRGPGNSGTKTFDVAVTGALSLTGVGATVASAIVTILKGFNIQSRLDGDWEVSAAKIVDAIGRRMALNP